MFLMFLQDKIDPGSADMLTRVYVKIPFWCIQGLCLFNLSIIYEKKNGSPMRKYELARRLDAV